MLIKAMSLPQDFLSTSDRPFIKLENQVQRLMEAHLAPMQPTQVNKITTSCEICSGPHDTRYFMEDHEQAFVEYASSRTDEAGVYGKKFRRVRKEYARICRKYELRHGFTILDSIATNMDPSCQILGITFKTPYKDPEMSELSSEDNDLLSSRIILSEDDYDRGCRKPSDLQSIPTTRKLSERESPSEIINLDHFYDT
ncbi:hypothetical protein Tco_0500601 [Tanacetum coccineum]